MRVKEQNLFTYNYELGKATENYNYWNYYSYRSYGLGVQAAYHDKCMSADVWPEIDKVKMWLFRRHKKCNPRKQCDQADVHDNVQSTSKAHQNGRGLNTKLNSFEQSVLVHACDIIYCGNRILTVRIC
jgi:hypothetical protein